MFYVEIVELESYLADVRKLQNKLNTAEGDLELEENREKGIVWVCAWYSNNRHVCVQLMCTRSNG